MKRTYLTEGQIATMQSAVDANVDFQTARKIAVEIGLTDVCGLPLDVWAKPAQFNVGYAFRYRMYDPADFGKDCKMLEVADRADWNRQHGRPMKWADFSARKESIVDNRFAGICFERKGGTGRWYSGNSDLEYWIRYTLSRKTWIWFTYETDQHSIEIITTYDKWWKILAGYNPKKGIATWFKWNDSRKEWDFQSLSNSDRKLRWLESHNCDDRP